MIACKRTNTLRLVCLCLGTGSLCLGPLTPAHSVAVSGGSGSASTSPSVTLAAPLGPVQSASVAGAPVTLTATVTSPSDADVTVQWSVDGTVAQTTITGGTAITGVATTFTQNYAPGTYTVTVTVSDGINPAVTSAPVTVTVLPPVSTGNAKVTGGGNFALGDSAGTFGFVAMTNPQGKPEGNLVFQDHATGLTIKSLEITGLIVTDTHAEFWGKAIINDDGEYDFIVDVDDYAEPGAGVDTFSVQVSNGYSASGPVIDGGNIQIHD